MVLAATQLPYGLRDCKVTAYTDGSATTLAASSTDLPNARTFSFDASTASEELRGDDTLVAIHENGEDVDWSLEGGGLDFAACKVMFGGTITTTGVSPNTKKTWSKLVTDPRPYFKIEGQAISDSGGDVHCVLDRCKSTGSLSGEFSDGSFFLTGADGKALGSLLTGRVGMAYEFVANETATAVA